MPRNAKAKSSSKDSVGRPAFKGCELVTGRKRFARKRRWQWRGATRKTERCPKGERGGVHQFGFPSNSDANFARLQHFIHHLATQTALRDSAFLQSEASPQVLSKAKNNMAALPGQLFYSTQIPVCLWFLAKNKNADTKRGFRDRRKQTLFIDARKLGTLSPKLGIWKSRPALQSQLN